MEKRRVRSSNFELLRVLAMLMIIIHHINVHCIFYQLTDKSSINLLHNGLFCHPILYKKLFLVQASMTLGGIANALFIIISGYFMVEKGKALNIVRTTKKLLLQVAFVTIFLTIATYIYYSIYRPANNMSIGVNTIADFNTMNWFVGYYFLIILIGKLFLNGFIESLDQKGYTALLFALLGIVSFSWSGLILDGLIDGFRVLTTGIFLYSLGGYIKRYNVFEKIKTFALIIALVFMYGMLYISYSNTVTKAIQDYLVNPTDKFIQPFSITQYYSIIYIICAVIIFEIFRRFKMPNSEIINFLGKSTFMIYLLHDNEFWRCLWRQKDWITILSKNTSLLFIRLMKWVVFIFVLGVILYALFIGISKLCEKCKFFVLKA
jgi:hypothetical protein